MVLRRTGLHLCLLSCAWCAGTGTLDGYIEQKHASTINFVRPTPNTSKFIILLYGATSVVRARESRAFEAIRINLVVLINVTLWLLSLYSATPCDVIRSHGKTHTDGADRSDGRIFFPASNTQNAWWRTHSKRWTENVLSAFSTSINKWIYIYEYGQSHET